VGTLAGIGTMKSLFGESKKRFCVDRAGALDFLGTALVKFVGLPLAFLANLLIARLLGPKEFGVYITLLSIALVIGGVATYGLPPVLVREISSVQPDKWPNIFKSVVLWAVKFSLKLSLIAMIFTLVWLQLGIGIPASSLVEKALTVIVIPLSVIANILVGVLSGMSRVSRGQMIHMVLRNGSLLLGASLLFIIGERRTEYFLFLQVLSFLIAIVISLAWIFSLLLDTHGDISFTLDFQSGISSDRAKSLRRSALNFLSVSLAWMVLGRLDVVLVNALAGTIQAGIFGISARLGQLGGVVGLLWIAWLQPRINSHNRISRNSVISLMKLSFLGSVSMTLLLICAGWLFGPYLMDWLGNGFVQGVAPFRWILLGYLPWAASVPFYAYLSMTGREVYLSRVLWIQVLLTVVASFPLVVSFGALGAAWSWTGGLTLGSLIIILLAISSLKNSV